jgi:hypothetical protein
MSNGSMNDSAGASGRDVSSEALVREGRAAFAETPESKVTESKPLMLRLELLPLVRRDPLGSKSTRRAEFLRTSAWRLCLWLGTILVGVFVPAGAQTFTVTATAFNPFAILPGRNSSALVTVTAGTGFSGTVDLTCTVVSTTGTTSNVPVCQMTPATVTPTAQSSLTVSGLTSAGGPAAAGTYTVTVTGTQGSSISQQSQNITILTAAPGFTITVLTPVQPGSVHAGSGATATISVTPLPGYTGTITLSCATITPLVNLPPYCSFNPQPLTLSQGSSTSTLTINTYGPINTGVGSLWRIRGYYALLLPLPMIVFLGAGVAIGGKRSRRVWSLLGLLILGGILLLVPGCGTNTGNTTLNPTGSTPKNSYTLTVTGVDTKGTVATNATGATAPSVTLTVN